MPAKSFAVVAAALLAAAPLVHAGSTLKIRNSCDAPIYIFKRQGSGITGDKITKGPGEELSEGCAGEAATYMIHSENTDDPCGPGSPCTQLEYSEKDMLYYDVSNINGYPFSKHGLTLLPDDKECPTVHCPPGESVCKDAYNNPPDERTLTCKTGCTINLDLCKPNETQDSDSGDFDSSSADTEQTPKQEPEQYKAPSDNQGQQYQAPPKPQPQQYGGQKPDQPVYGQAAPNKEDSPPPKFGAKVGGYSPIKQRPDGEVYAESQPDSQDNSGSGDTVVTTMVTKYAYVNQKRQEATAVPQPRKRHEHLHRHAHGAAHRS